MVVTCEIKHQNNFKIISLFYFACICAWNWNKIISSIERVLKMFQNYCSDIEHVGKYLQAAIIPWNNFSQVSTCWNKIISVGCRQRLKSFWNDYFTCNHSISYTVVTLSNKSGCLCSTYLCCVVLKRWCCLAWTMYLRKACTTQETKVEICPRWLRKNGSIWLRNWEFLRKNRRLVRDLTLFALYLFDIQTGKNLMSV